MCWTCLNPVFHSGTVTGMFALWHDYLTVQCWSHPVLTKTHWMKCPIYSTNLKSFLSAWLFLVSLLSVPCACDASRCRTTEEGFLRVNIFAVCCKKRKRKTVRAETKRHHKCDAASWIIDSVQIFHVLAENRWVEFKSKACIPKNAYLYRSKRIFRLHGVIPVSKPLL